MDFLSTDYPCRICGKHTETWVELDLSTKTCTCCTKCLSEWQKIKPPAPLLDSFSAAEQAFADYQPEIEQQFFW